MRILPFRPVLPNTALIASADTFFGVVKHDYLEYRHRGMFVEYPADVHIVYRLREAGHDYLGLITAVPNAAYREGRIRRHEGTLAVSEQQQLQLLVLREAVVKPVLLTYPASARIDALLERATRGEGKSVLALADGEDIHHELFAVSAEAPLGVALTEAFAKTVDALYIADGHHRCSVLDLYNRQLEAQGEPGVPLLSALFSSEQVRVRAYHRAVQLPVDLSPLSLMARLSDLFAIAPTPEPALPGRRHDLTMLLGDEGFRLTWRASVLPEHGIVLDAGLFNELVAGPIFGIDDVRTDERIAYVPGSKGLRGMLDRVQRRPDRVGFMLHGLEARDMFAVVDAGMIMPPKSTWFEPRMRNGLVVMEV